MFFENYQFVVIHRFDSMYVVIESKVKMTILSLHCIFGRVCNPVNTRLLRQFDSWGIYL